MSSIQTALMSQPLPLSQASGPGFAQPTPQGAGPAKAAKDFESVFTSMLLKEMRSSLEEGSLFGEDTSDIYGGLFDQFMGQHMTDAGGLGMAKMVQEALERTAQAEHSQPNQ